MTENTELWEYTKEQYFNKALKEINKVIKQICTKSQDKFRALEICKKFLNEEIEKIKLPNTLM